MNRPKDLNAVIAEATIRTRLLETDFSVLIAGMCLKSNNQRLASIIRSAIAIAKKPCPRRDIQVTGW